MLVVAAVADNEGLFVAAGAWMAQRSRGSAPRLLALVFAVAAAVTVTLSLDTTILLLTPVVIATAARMRLDAQPYSYTCLHLANSASLLLPISNLTNLLAFQATGVSFLRFGGLMLLPWLRRARRAVGRAARRLRPRAGHGAGRAGPSEHHTVPRHVLPVLGLSLVGLRGQLRARARSRVDRAGHRGRARRARALAARASARRTSVRALNVPFLAFVPGLAIVVEAVARTGWDVVGRRCPGGDALPSLLAIAGIAAVLANLVNNLPA